MQFVFASKLVGKVNFVRINKYGFEIEKWSLQQENYTGNAFEVLVYKDR